MQPPAAPLRAYPTVDRLSDGTVADLLRTTKRIALVGASTDPDRPSHRVMRFLLECGYDVTPINPNHLGETIHGRAVVATLDEAAPLDMVDDEIAAKRARAASIVVVMDRCPVIED